jgi:hypothetical protein
MENYTQDQLSNVDIQIDEEVRNQFGEMAKWTKFISIVIFVLAAIIFIVGVLGGGTIMSIFDAYGGGMLDTFFGLGAGILIAIIAFAVLIMSVIYYFLFRFAKKVKTALATEDVLQLNEALSALKIFFIIMTILSILGVLLSLIKLF